MGNWVEQLGADRQGLQIVRSLDELRGLGHLSTPHAIEVAWTRMRLDAVVVIGRSAAVYVKQVGSFEPAMEHRLHGQLWLHGTAPLLLVVDPAQLRIYSSRPKKPGQPQGRAACVEVLDRVKHALAISHLLERVQVGDYFQLHRDHFLPSNAVDWHFGNQLERTRDVLAQVDARVSVAKIHQLLVGALLLRYLSDRRALSEAFFRVHLAGQADGLEQYLRGPGKSRTKLARVFAAIEKALGFLELKAIRDLISDRALRDEHFDLVSRFLTGEDVATGQLALGDWVFDLSMLPVELISTVYQEFVSAEVDNAKKKLGLVATPRFLAETVLDLAFDGVTVKQPRVLDPACGSGVFLVGSFNRLAHGLGSATSALPARRALSKLTRLLRENIVGVELRPTACALARLNLLHALLGHFSRAQLRELLEGSASARDSGRPATQVHTGSFFDDHEALPKHSFDLVVGNPPWSKDKAAMEGWIDDRKDLRIPDRGNLVYGFAWRGGEFLATNGRACLLLDAKAMLTAPSARRFGERWFTANRIDVLVNLTNLRAHLFGRKAGRAAAIFLFSASEPEPTDTVHYVTPMASDGVRRGGVLDISGARSQRVMYSEVLSAARHGTLPFVWRVRLHGTGRDANLLDRLRRLPRLSKIVEGSGWGFHQGFNRHGGNNPPERRKLLAEIPYLPTTARGIWAYRFPSRRLTRPYGTEENELGMLVRDWPKHADRLFKGERVVIHHTPLREPPMLRTAYVRRAFTFHKELKGLFAPPGESQLLKFISAALSSSIAFYYYFHTSLSWGVEAQPQLRRADFLEFPLPPPRNDVSREAFQAVVQLVDDLSPRLAQKEYEATLREQRRELNEMLMTYYGLDEWERDLVNDCETHLSEAVYGKAPTKWGKVEKRGECHSYIERLTSALSQWSRDSAVSGEAYVSDDAGLGLVVLRRGPTTTNGTVEVLDDDDQLAQLLKQVHLLLRQRGSGRPARDVMVFEGKNLYITKPLHRRHWTRTAALNDADTIAAALIGNAGND